MLAIKTENLTKNYKKLCALDNLNLEVEQGELFALLGLNGAGKTTCIKMLSCLVKPTSGNAFIYGNSILDNSIKAKELLSVSPQETAVAPMLNVEENLIFMCQIYGHSLNESKAKTTKIMEDLGLDSVKDKNASKLSGGWQRRLSIAMALVSEPKLLFLDEPTLGLDVIARNELWQYIKALKGKITIVLTTHYLEEVEALADRVGILGNGKLLGLGTCDELIAKANATNFEDAFIKLSQGGAK